MPASCSMEGQTLEGFRSVEHPSRIGECTGFSKRRSKNNAQPRNWAQNAARRKPIRAITDHQAAECASVAWHRAQGAFIPKGATAERCTKVMSPLGRPWYKKPKERNKEPGSIQATAWWASWAHGCLEGRRREGAILIQQRCQWSAARAGVTSVLRLHDATYAYLSMKHDVAKQAANKMASKEIDQFYFDPRISLASGDGWRRGGQH